MRKGFLFISSSLIAAIVLLGILVSGCSGGGGVGETTIEILATLCGSTWSGNVSYVLTPETGSPFNGNKVPASFSVDAGSWSCAYASGGPGGVGTFLRDISPSPTQTVAENKTITFTLNFELGQDASISWTSWTQDGLIVDGSELIAEPCHVIGAHFGQLVMGCCEGEGFLSALNETAWLKIQESGNSSGPATVYVVDNWCAVNKTPDSYSPFRTYQVPSIDGFSAEKGDNTTLIPGGPQATLDVDTGWYYLHCVNHVKSINWFGISTLPQFEMSGPHTCVLFELVVPGPGVYQFTLVTSAEVGLADGVDANPANDSTTSPVLLLTVNVGP